MFRKAVEFRIADPQGKFTQLINLTVEKQKSLSNFSSMISQNMALQILRDKLLAFYWNEIKQIAKI